MDPRARAGYTFDGFMLYGTGGVAFAQTKIDAPFASASQIEPDWKAGGRVQYLWSESAIFQLEYRRTEIQSRNFYSLTRTPTNVGVAMNVINAAFYFEF